MADMNNSTNMDKTVWEKKYVYRKDDDCYYGNGYGYGYGRNWYDDNRYASKGVGGAGLGLGIAGTALGLLALSRNGGGLFGGYGNNGMPQNVNINTGETFGHSGHTPSAFDAYDHSCEGVLALTNEMWGLKMNTFENAKQAREVDVAEKFSLWKSQVDADFGLYKSQVDADFGLYKNQRDQFDVLNKEISDLKCRVAVNEAIRPYQDALIQCDINNARKDAAYNLDRRTCRMIEGQVVLPSTPAVTGFGSYNTCRCGNNATA